jgi:hypothetical protein
MYLRVSASALGSGKEENRRRKGFGGVRVRRGWECEGVEEG